MPMELSPRVRKVVEALGCPNVSSSDEAYKKLLEMLADAERRVDRLVVEDEVPPVAVVRKVSREFLLNARRFATFFGRGDLSTDETVDVSMMCGMLAMLATSATCMLKDMAFLVGADVGESCGGCSRFEECARKLKGKGSDDEKGGR